MHAKVKNEEEKSDGYIYVVVYTELKESQRLTRSQFLSRERVEMADNALSAEFCVCFITMTLCGYMYMWFDRNNLYFHIEFEPKRKISEIR